MMRPTGRPQHQNGSNPEYALHVTTNPFLKSQKNIAGNDSSDPMKINQNWNGNGHLKESNEQTGIK